VQTIQGLGCAIDEIEFPVDTDRTVQAVEAYAVYSPMLEECSSKCHPQTLQRLNYGAEITATEYICKKRELDRQRRDAFQIFSGVDLVVTPTVREPAPGIAELDPNLPGLRPRELLMLRNTRPWNVLGLPAISLPCGFTQEGLPLGLQIVGPAGAETGVLALAHAYEQATEWHKHKPDDSRRFAVSN
jgi:Asp-tRNA(Asn)/Glu-tRNA(Gln) amidotransferase A subunit family amidase